MTSTTKDVFYMYLSSEDSKDIYPRNRPHCFNIQLPERVNLTGTWTVALAEVDYPCIFNGKTPWWIIFEVTLCDASIVGNKKMSVLRRLPVENLKVNRLSFNPMFHVPIRQQEFDNIQVYIRDPAGNQVSFAEGFLTCTLQFKRT